MVKEIFTQTCRTCLSTNGEMVPIFSSGVYVNQLPEKLMAFVKVEISDNDALPKVICKKCMFLADSFYCFKEQCESAENRLKLLIQKSSNKEKKATSDSQISKIDPESVATFKSADLSLKDLKNEAKNSLEESQEIEENYITDYISDEVKMEVEKASKRRREAERRVSMEKVSQSLKNLKGIEVVPITDVAASRSERNRRMKQEEIVVFPVTRSNKRRCKVVETIVVDDTPTPNKRLKLPPETTVSEIKGGRVKREDYIVYGKHKKLNFSTVRRVVKIHEEEFCLDPKQENIKESDKENCRIKCDSDLVAVANGEDKRNPSSRYSKIKIDKKPDVLEAELAEVPEDEKNFKTQLFQTLDSAPVHNHDVTDQNESNEQLDDPQTDKKCTNHQSGIENPVKTLASLKSIEPQRQDSANDFKNYEIVTKSTIGCIISEIDNENCNDIDQPDDGEDASTPENTNVSPKNFFDYRTDRINEVFIENDVSYASDNCTTARATLCTKSCFEDSKIEQETIKKNEELISNSKSDQENSTTILKISKRDDSERVGKTMGEVSAVKDEKSDDSAQQNLRSLNLRNYQCTICLMNFVSMPFVLKHNIQEHMANKAPFLCLICDKSFEDKPLLCEHVEDHNGLKPYKCTFCPKSFTLKRNLKRHVDHHINYKPFQCRICMKRFTEKSSLKSHMYLHTGDSPFACKSCNVSFNNKTNWRRHVITIHEKLTLVVCKFCNKELPDKRSLQVHSRIHTGDRPYRCPHCDKRFTQQCNLNTHIHCHLNDRPFGCPHCGKGFNQRGTRDDHILTHTGEKPHKCTHCDASFTVSSALKRHMWIHTDKDRPYNCEKCKLQFVGLYDLRRHLKIRHGEVVKPENPRVERVLVDDQNKEAMHLNTLGQRQLDLDETEGLGPPQSSGDIECSKADITAKENSSLSCNVNKIEDVHTEDWKESFSETKFENFNNETKTEPSSHTEMFTGDCRTPISCADDNEH